MIGTPGFRATLDRRPTKGSPISNTAPDQPVIHSGSMTDTTWNLTCDPFSDDDEGDTHQYTSWEVASDDGFVFIVDSSLEDAVNKMSWQATGLEEETEYWARCRQADQTEESANSSSVTDTTESTPAGPGTFFEFDAESGWVPDAMENNASCQISDDEAHDGNQSIRFNFAGDDSPAPEDSGTASSATINTLTDSAKSWTPDEWDNGLGGTDGATYVVTTGGTGSGQRNYIVGNTSTRLDLEDNWDVTPDETTTYEIREVTDDWAETRYDAGADHDEIWVEAWVFVPANFDKRWGNDKFWFGWSDDMWGGYPGGGQDTSFMWTSSKGTTPYRTTMKFQWADGVHPMKSSWQISAVDFFDEDDLGEWVQFRFHVKLGLDGGTHTDNARVGTGVTQLWKDGVLKMDEDDLSWDPNASPTRNDYLRCGYLMGWSNAGYYVNTKWYMDGIKFYSSDPGW